MDHLQLRPRRSARTLLASAILLVGLTGTALAWGAIAVDDEEGRHHDDVGYGASSGHNSEAAAKAGALRECRRHGNEDCRVIVTFRHCGAYAVAGRHYGYGEATTLASARRDALEHCGGGACKIVVSHCE
ncbi:MAG TPA: DUF4189 domain-containing protein [Pseudolabrys sp.]|nr:DUF4189 domain-containing protein [Pseudolabrys sp.]